MRIAVRTMLIGAVLSGAFVGGLSGEARAQGPMVAVPPPAYYYAPGGPRAYRGAWKRYARSPHAVPLAPVAPAYVHGAPYVVRPERALPPGTWTSPGGYYYRPNYRSEVMTTPVPAPPEPAMETIPAPRPEGD